MSLHIGGLSSSVQKEYLEQVFQKFGRCTVRIKDRYGFAVFNARIYAARALRELHGKMVCGKRITVNWSKHQPNISRSYRSSRRIGSSDGRATRGGVDSYRFRNLADEKNDYASQDVSQNPDDGVEMKNHRTSHDSSHKLDDVVEKNSHEIAEGLEGTGENIGEDPVELKMDEGGTSGANPIEHGRHMSHDKSHKPDDAVVKHCDEIAEGLEDAGGNIGEDPVELKMDEGGTSVANPIEHDRWGETGIRNHGGDDDNFDRFEPYHGYGKQEEKEKIVKADHRRFPKKWQEHPAERFVQNHGRSRYFRTCSNWGTAGHTTGSCTEETVGKFKRRGDGLSLREKGELRLRKFRYPSTRQPEYRVDPMIQAHQRVQNIRKPFSDRIGRAPKLSDVRMNRRHTLGENMPEVPKEARNGGKLKRSRESSLSSDRASSYSRSRSPRLRSGAQSPSHSAHSSSKSSQPTQPEGVKLVSRSNVSYHCPLSVSVSPQCDSPLAARNENSGVLVDSPLGSNLDLKAASEFKHFDDCKQEVKGSNLNCEVPSTSSKLDTQSNGDLPVPGKDVKEHLVKNGRSISLKLTTAEVVSALKHYGVEAREIVLSNQPVENYFGAARLWPWQIIYYRRRKKGPISTENYARRLEQNKEFGIVDQYVRSSSGWWECR